MITDIACCICAYHCLFYTIFHLKNCFCFLQGDISSTSTIGAQNVEDMEFELNKTKAELDKSIGEHMKSKEDSASKEKILQDNLNKLEEQTSTFRLENERLKNQVEIMYFDLRELALIPNLTILLLHYNFLH